MHFQTPFIPGSSLTVPGPLSRFLPPISSGTGSSWLETAFHRVQRSYRERIWILDPFCSSPQLAMEIGQAGYCVLVTAVNPITRYLLEMQAQAPDQSELRSSLAALGSTIKGSDRLEPYINRLYRTRCPECDSWVIADSFIWEKDIQKPIKRNLHCTKCGLEGEFPTTHEDVELANMHSSPLHKARALERVAPMHDPDRENAQHALEMYLDRSLYALFTLINKIEQQTEANQMLLRALMISVCDRGSKLWHYPAEKSRPRQLAIPPQYFEMNLWKSLEYSIDEWISDHSYSRNVPVTIWPDLPPESGGICIFEGRLKDLISAVQSDDGDLPDIQGVLFAYPRPTQAFWTLSVLWSRWLFPFKQTQSFKPVLRRRRFDWGWHTNALHSTLSHLRNIVPAGTPILGIIGEVESGFITASILANELAELHLTGFAMRSDIKEAQVHLTTDPDNKSNNRMRTPRRDLDIICRAITEYLSKSGEPAKYLQIYTTALLTLSSVHPLKKITGASPAEKYTSLQQLIEEVITSNKEIYRISGSEYSIDTGEWWLTSSENVAELSLSDRIEAEIIHYLKANPVSNLSQIDRYLCERFTGLLTPSHRLIETCLLSYAGRGNGDTPRWSLKEQEVRGSRSLDILQIVELLITLGQKLECSPETIGENQVVWRDHFTQTIYHFFVLATAIITPIIYSDTFVPKTGIIVLPGSRASLVAYRSRHDPRLNIMIEKGLRIIKFRHIRRIANERNISMDKFVQMLEIDPLKRNDPQLPLL